MRRAKIAQREDAARPPSPRGKLAFGTLDQLLGFRVRMAQAAIYRDFAAAVGVLELTQSQFAVLELIGVNPGVSQIDLAEALGTDRATMMALVDRIDARGWIERSVSASDRRRQELRLSPAGQGDLERARGLSLAHEARLLAGGSAAERPQIIALLDRITAR